MSHFPAGLETAAITVNGQRLLGGLYLAAGETPRPTVLLLHGVPGLEQNRDLAYALRDAGLNCLFFHYRGCWGSAGAYSLAGQLEDTLAAAAWARTHPAVDPERLALIGYSFGGYTALAAAAADPGFKAAAVIGPVIDPAGQPLAAATFDDFASSLQGVSGADLAAQWQALPSILTQAPALAGRPVLLVTAGQDADFPPAHYQPLAQALPGLRWESIADADHVFSRHRAPLVSTVGEWLQKVI